MGNIGSTELLIVLALALILLGPKRLPEIGTALGRTMRRFREASRDLRSELDVGRDLRRDLDVRRDLDLRSELDDTDPPKTPRTNEPRSGSEPESP